MSTTNALYLRQGGHLVPLDLFDDTALLVSYQCNDRTKPESIQSDYSPEFEVPGTAHNHRLLRHAAASQPTQGQSYARLPCVLTSGGVEILPLGLLYIKGYKEGRYQLQVAGGNRRLVEALGDKTLADLNLTRFDHAWTPANVLAGLPYAHWQSQGWGYEVYDRGKQPLDLQNLSPYDLYPSVAGQLVFTQILTDAGFTADDLSSEPLFAALNVPTANPFTYSQDFREKRRLQAGFFHVPNYDPNTRAGGILHEGGFAPERLNFSYVEHAPFHAPDYTTGTTYNFGRYTVSTLGYYDLAASVTLRFGCRSDLPGKVRCKLMLKVNGQSVFASNGGELGADELEVGDYTTHTFTPKLNRYKLVAGDYVELWWQGTELPRAGVDPTDPYWQIGPWGSQTALHYPVGSTLPDLSLANEVQFTCALLAEFPQGGLVRLQDWLPDLKQLDFVKMYMLLGGLTIQADAYTNHLRLSTGAKLLSPEQVAKASDWTRKRDAFAPPGRLPERELAYRFGSYAQRNYLKWAEDETVTAGYGDGSIAVADEVLPASYDLATLPFAASEPSPNVAGLLLLANFEKKDITATDYSSVTAKARLVLRRADGTLSGQLITTPQVGKPGDQNYAPAVLTAFTTTPSYFAGAGVSLLLDSVLTTYWADLRAMLDQSRYLTERYRLTPADIAGVDFSIPIWDGALGDYFAVSAVSEYSANRSVEVRLCRLNATHLPPPVVPGSLVEWWGSEFYHAEWY